MPIPAITALTINSAAESTNKRENVATPMISSDNMTVRWSPSRRLTPMPKNIASPMAITGSIVNSEARLKLNGISSRIADSSGPIAAIEGRRLSATRTMASISQTAGRVVARGFSIFRPLSGADD